MWIVPVLEFPGVTNCFGRLRVFAYSSTVVDPIVVAPHGGFSVLCSLGHGCLLSGVRRIPLDLVDVPVVVPVLTRG